MKTLRVLAVCLILLGSSLLRSSAQGFYFGPKAGLNLSSVSKMSNSISRVRGQLGLFAGYQAGDILALQLEALYSWQGASTDEYDTRYKTSLNYLKIPILAKVFIIGGLNLEAGISFNFLMSAREKAHGDNEGIKGLNGFDFSIPVGINYLIANRLEVGLRYDISFVNLDIPGSKTAKNSNLALSVGYRF